VGQRACRAWRTYQEVKAAEAVPVGGVLPLEDLDPLLDAGPAHTSTHTAGKGGSRQPTAGTRPLEPNIHGQLTESRTHECQALAKLERRRSR
jgi:hypothetical protein